MGAWFPQLDAAVGGVADVIEGGAQTTGDAAGSLIGGATSGFADWLLKLAVIAALSVVAVAVVIAVYGG